ncbi:MAG: glycoside hydrolase family 2 TIM barrel-domain containing protein [Myxococcota bacterium]
MSVQSASWFVLLAGMLLARPGTLHSAPIPVELVHESGRWQMLREGKPYRIRGAGGDGSLERLVTAGANTLRTWGADNIRDRLDAAHEAGLAVVVGIWLGHERHGFDYTDADQVAEQYERARQRILAYRSHPALLMWGIGNEMEGFEAGDNAAIYSAVNNIASLAKKLDPYHLTMTVTAEIGGDRVKNINRLCPDIDVHGINAYGGIRSLPKRYRQSGGTKPYVVTEFGPPGAWESPATEWHVPIELTSTAKADHYFKGYRAIAEDEALSLGSFAFLWSWKVEATPTWFGMFLPDGSKLAAVDAMTDAWGGRAPANRVPRIETLEVVGDPKRKPGDNVRIRSVLSDPDSDNLSVDWVLRDEAKMFNTGGDESPLPPERSGTVLNGDLRGATIRLPREAGSYRVYVTVRDGDGGAAVGNLPLQVRGAKPSVTRGGHRLPLVIYEDGPWSPHPYVPSGYMGDHRAISMDPLYAREPRSGRHSLRIRLDAERSSWAGVAWQNPPNDWGELPGGLDLRGASRLTFWARGAHGGENIKFGLGLIGTERRYPDSARVEIGEVTLRTKWRRFVIDLDDADLSRIKTGFYWVSAAPVEFFLDAVAIE